MYFYRKGNTELLIHIPKKTVIIYHKQKQLAKFFNVSTSREVTIEINYYKSASIHKIWVTIPEAYNGYQKRLYDFITFNIERIGE